MHLDICWCWGHRKEVLSVDFHPYCELRNGDFIISKSVENELVLWQPKTKEQSPVESKDMQKMLGRKGAAVQALQHSVFVMLLLELPEMKAALQDTLIVDNLPMLQMPQETERPFNDILEWLSLRFRFQVAMSTRTSVKCF